MKHVFIALALTTAALSFGAKATTCDQIFNETTFVTSGEFVKVYDTAPKETLNFRASVIKECEGALIVGSEGYPASLVSSNVLSGYKQEGALNSLLVSTRLQMSLAGWSIGAESRK